MWGIESKKEEAFNLLKRSRRPEDSFDLFKKASEVIYNQIEVHYLLDQGWDDGMPKMVSNANAIFIASIGLNRYEKDLKINVELLYGR